MRPERLRVLFCTLEYPPSPVGGAERQAQLQAEELKRLGHEVQVVCQRTAGSHSGMVNGVRVHRLPRIDRRPLRTVSYLMMLAAFLLLRLRKFDLVHVHLANAQADVAVAMAQLLRRPSYVKLAAGGPLGEIGRFKRVARLTRYHGIRAATAVQAISAEIARDLRRIGVPEARIRHIPNGVRMPHVDDEGRARARRDLGFAEDEIVVLNAARLEREKGGAALLEAWSTVSPSAARLIVIGAQGIKDPVDVSNLPPRAEYRGWTSDVESFLRGADIFVLPSQAEGMSNAVLEAMAMGVPCVVTRVGAATEMIEDGRTGLLVDVDDRDALVAAMQRLLDDPGLRAQMGHAARESVGARYGIEAVVARIVDAYRAAVAST